MKCDKSHGKIVYQHIYHLMIALDNIFKIGVNIK